MKVGSWHGVVVIDHGTPEAHQIIRALRALNVPSFLLPVSAPKQQLVEYKPTGVVLAAPPDGATGHETPPELLDLKLPLFALGGAARRLREHNASRDTGEGALFATVHADEYLLSAAPAVDTPEQLAEALRQFVHLSNAPQTWTAEEITARSLRSVRETTGGARVLLGISGGVDSSTLGVLLHRAIGEQLEAVFVDHGLLRQNEAAEVTAALSSLGIELHLVDASERFLTALAGVSDPETKRKIIGREFIEVFSAEARRLQRGTDPIRFLAQGTVYPDVMESMGVDGAVKVKSHHNVGGLPPDLAFDLIEPFRTLFKDEVRSVAAELGLPPSIRDRHPFPGPGLAVRIIGAITRERLDLLRRVDHVFTTALHEYSLYQETWQAFAVLTDVRSVGSGVTGRSYGQAVALRAVSTIDGVTAAYTPLPHEFLAEVAARISKAVPEVNRVVYDITSKPPGTIEWE